MPTEQVKQSEQAKQAKQAKQEEYKPENTSTLNPARKLRVKVIKMQKPGWNDWWELRVAKTQKETQKEMQKDIAAYEEENCLPLSDATRVLGQVSPCTTISFDKDSSSLGMQFATMFLNQEDLSPGVIAHECLHLAMAHERFIHFAMDYGSGDTDIDDEERLAYYLTACIRGVYTTLIEQKIIDPKKEFKLV